MKTNLNQSVHKLTKEETKNLNAFIDGEIRSFSKFHALALGLWDASHIDEVTESRNLAKKAMDEAKGTETAKDCKRAYDASQDRYNTAIALQSSDIAKSAIETLRIKLAKLAYEELSLQFLKTWLPLNSRGQICDIQNIKLENESDAIEMYPNGNALGYELIRDSDSGNLKLYKPVQLWTSAKYIAKFTTAINLRERARNQASQIEREKIREENERKRYEAAKLRVSTYELQHGISNETTKEVA